MSATDIHPAAAPLHQDGAASSAARWAALAYGALVYGLFLGTFVYAIGFVGGLLVPRTIDGGASAPLGQALLVNGALLLLFAVQHNVMARPWFKRAWTRVVPPVAERSTFVLFTCAILITLFVNWRAVPDVVWTVSSPVAAGALWALQVAGWLTVLVATFQIDHFELFGLKQAVLFWLGREHRSAPYQERGLYRVVRHPLMLGFIVAFWATPVMTVGHLMFAAITTGWIFVALRIEEHTLVSLHGDSYLDYRRRVPGLLPFLRRAA
jgi:protein-S-isoprenylcysteine O-methyltransferase Ste14